MALHGEGHVVGHTPANNNEGWPFALFICAFAVACWITAWTIKTNTYHDPTDPMAPDRGRAPAAHAAPAAPAAEH